MARTPVKPRENAERAALVKTVQMLNPNIDYQDAAAAYDDYFTPLKDRATSSANESRNPRLR